MGTMLNNKFCNSAVREVGRLFFFFFFQKRDIMELMQCREMDLSRILLWFCLVTLEPCCEHGQPSELRL